MIDRRFSFMPGAIFYPKHGGMGAYVRYKGAEDLSKKTVVKEYRPNYLWLDCPDREVILINDQNKMESWIPMGCNFDEYFDLDMSNEYAADAMGIEYLMVNYVQHDGQPDPAQRRVGSNPNTKLKYVSDSGGFQLMTEKVSFIDPRKIIEWYNLNVDMGMVLDIPVVHEDEKISQIKRLAWVQRRNTDLMMLNKADHVDLINIFHGVTPAQKAAFREIVEDDRIDRLALGGEYYNNVVNGTNNLMTTILNGRHYKHFHLLGIFNLAQLAIIVKVAEWEGNHALITSDASTHIQSASRKIYHGYLGQRYSPKRMNIGDADRIPTISNETICNCKACRAVKYMDILGSVDGAITTFILAYHNMYEVNRFSRMLYDICRDTTHKEYREFVKYNLRHHKGLQYTLHALDFVQHVAEHGIESARKKYSQFLQVKSVVKELDVKPLFGNLIQREDEGDDEEHEVDDENYLDRVLNVYENFHDSVQAGTDDKFLEKYQHNQKNKEREKDKKGSGRAAGVIAGAGVKAQKKRVKRAKQMSDKRVEQRLKDKEKAKENATGKVQKRSDAA